MKKLIPLLILLMLLTGCSTKEERSQYENGLALYEEGKYTAALNAFEAADGYKKSEHYIKACKYYSAMHIVSPDSSEQHGYSGNISCTPTNAEQFPHAIQLLHEAEGYKSSDRMAQDAQRALDDYNNQSRLSRLVTVVEKQLVGYVDDCKYDNGNFFLYLDENYPITMSVVVRGRTESQVAESWKTVRGWFTDAVFEYIPDCTVYILDSNEEMLGVYSRDPDTKELVILFDAATKPY